MLCESARESHSVPLQFAADFRGIRFGRRVTQHRTDAQVSDDLGPKFTGTAVSVKPKGQVTVCGINPVWSIMS